MAQTSPILRFALEVLHHALENYASATPRHRKIAVLNLAQAVELAVKAALVEKNVPIFEKNSRTLVVHDALDRLAALWGVERIAYHARVELLADERNAIQHRYGHVDDVSLDYHMETTFGVLREILEREFDTALDTWVRDTVDEVVWKKIRFVGPTTEPPSAASQPERSATLDFIDGFARFERSIQNLLALYQDDGTRFTGSTLDFAIKALSNTPSAPATVIRDLPKVYKLRNRAIHGDLAPGDADVRDALETLDAALTALVDTSDDVIDRAYRASTRGIRGTRLPSRAEEAQDDFEGLPLGPHAADEGSAGTSEDGASGSARLARGGPTDP